ncbi:potassium-transporting ATPase subunit KdpA [Pseudomonas sp. PMCC200344]|uniref:potassium-transporting ATPase subunit KdpA n=1 Tax=Pseudomonas sp. PMCC200344 TaxID=3042028 RepID=UPI0024B3C643|nr:potassium-transporting ATPase subunit KdpA [Pseudomonas sp. PMCC200344]
MLLPLSLIFALFFVSQGVIQNLGPYKEVTTMEVMLYQVPALNDAGQPTLDAQGNPALKMHEQ